jgi:hypothetical protein
MAFIDLLTHSSRLRRKQREIQPEAIKSMGHDHSEIKILTERNNSHCGLSDLRGLQFTHEELIQAKSGQTISKTVVFDGDDGRYILAFEVRNPWQFELVSAESASSNRGIVAVSRISNSTEVWWVGANRSVQNASWYEGGQWQRIEIAHVGKASGTGSIVAVSRIPQSTEVWWIGADGSVQGVSWYEGSQRQQYELAPAGSAATSGGITAVSRIPNSLEVWWIGADGSVQGAFWYEGSQWQRYELAPAGSASIKGGLTAVSRMPNSMEVWWVGADGSVQGAFWYQ